MSSRTHTPSLDYTLPHSEQETSPEGATAQIGVIQSIRAELSSAPGSSDRRRERDSERAQHNQQGYENRVRKRARHGSQGPSEADPQ